MQDILKLDKLLRETIHYLIDNWYDEDTGIVASSLIDNDKISFATSTKNGHYWLHAERNAYTKFTLSYGEPSSHAIFVTTLSPCIQPLKYRSESSCSEFIEKLGIKRIHFGVLDTVHASSASSYSKMGLVHSLTQDPNVNEICAKLMGLFEIYNSRINSELQQIKIELGDLFFSSISKNL